MAAASAALAETPWPEQLPKDAKRLGTDEIKALMGTGATFEFVGAGGRTTGTSTWNLSTGTAYGSFTWDERLKGTWNLNWKVENDLSCLESQPPDTWECEEIYRYQDGFLEVDKDGNVHTFTRPKSAPALPSALTPDEAAKLFPDLMAWGQKLELTVVSSSETDGIITLVLADRKGTTSQIKINAATGFLLSSN